MRCATCCRRSQPCSMVASVATRSSGCRSCARPVSARGSSMPGPLPAAGLRQFLPRSAVAVRYPGRRVSPQRVQDELIGQMSELLGIDYDVLALDLTESESRHRALVSDPTPPSAPPTLPEPGAIARAPIEPAPSPATAAPSAGHPAAAPTRPEDDAAPSGHPRPALRQRLAVCLTSTSSLRHPRRNVSSPSSAWSPTSWAMCCRPTLGQRIAVDSRAGRGLYPISDIWHIDPGLDTPDRLRIHIAQFAREIAGEADLDACVEDRSDGIGFACRAPARFRRRSHVPCSRCWFPGRSAAGRRRLGRRALRHRPASAVAWPGQRHDDGARRLSDNTLVKLFRLLRLARRLLDLEAGAVGSGT